MLLKSGIHHLVDIDDNTPLKNFTRTCDSLYLKYDCVSKCNHKAMRMG